MYEELYQRTALVTGGSRGIGYSIVKVLLDHGVNVAYTYKNKPGDFGSEYSQERLKAYQMDVTNSVSVHKVVKEIEKDFGCIDFLVNNAGITHDKHMMLMKDQEWKEVIDTNLSGNFLVTKEVLPSILMSSGGGIVNISSVAGLAGVATQTNYCASKAGIIGMTKALATEIGRKGVRVNAVAPGYIDTDMLQKIKPSLQKEMTKKILLRRLAHPKEVASVVLFLLSDQASYITGTTIQVDGGIMFA